MKEEGKSSFGVAGAGGLTVSENGVCDAVCDVEGVSRGVVTDCDECVSGVVEESKESEQYAQVVTEGSRAPGTGERALQAQLTLALAKAEAELKYEEELEEAAREAAKVRQEAAKRVAAARRAQTLLRAQLLIASTPPSGLPATVPVATGRHYRFDRLAPLSTDSGHTPAVYALTGTRTSKSLDETKIPLAEDIFPAALGYQPCGIKSLTSTPSDQTGVGTPEPIVIAAAEDAPPIDHGGAGTFGDGTDSYDADVESGSRHLNQENNPGETADSLALSIDGVTGGLGASPGDHNAGEYPMWDHAPAEVLDSVRTLVRLHRAGKLNRYPPFVDLAKSHKFQPKSLIDKFARIFCGRGGNALPDSVVQRLTNDSAGLLYALFAFLSIGIYERAVLNFLVAKSALDKKKTVFSSGVRARIDDISTLFAAQLESSLLASANNAPAGTATETTPGAVTASRGARGVSSSNPRRTRLSSLESFSDVEQEALGDDASLHDDASQPDFDPEGGDDDGSDPSEPDSDGSDGSDSDSDFHSAGSSESGIPLVAPSRRARRVQFATTTPADRALHQLESERGRYFLARRAYEDKLSQGGETSYTISLLLARWDVLNLSLGDGRFPSERAVELLLRFLKAGCVPRSDDRSGSFSQEIAHEITTHLQLWDVGSKDGSRLNSSFISSLAQGLSVGFQVASIRACRYLAQLRHSLKHRNDFLTRDVLISELEDLCQGPLSFQGMCDLLDTSSNPLATISWYPTGSATANSLEVSSPIVDLFLTLATLLRNYFMVGSTSGKNATANVHSICFKVTRNGTFVKDDHKAGRALASRAFPLGKGGSHRSDTQIFYALCQLVKTNKCVDAAIQLDSLKQNIFALRWDVTKCTMPVHCEELDALFREAEVHNIIFTSAEKRTRLLASVGQGSDKGASKDPFGVRRSNFADGANLERDLALYEQSHQLSGADATYRTAFQFIRNKWAECEPLYMKRALSTDINFTGRAAPPSASRTASATSDKLAKKYGRKCMVCGSSTCEAVKAPNLSLGWSQCKATVKCDRCQRHHATTMHDAWQRLLETRQGKVQLRHALGKRKVGAVNPAILNLFMDTSSLAKAESTSSQASATATTSDETEAETVVAATKAVTFSSSRSYSSALNGSRE